MGSRAQACIQRAYRDGGKGPFAGSDAPRAEAGVNAPARPGAQAGITP